MTRRNRPRSDGSLAPRARRTPKPEPTPAELVELERLTESLPAPLRELCRRGLLSSKRRFYLEQAIRNRTRNLVVVLHGVHDPHNQAAVMRSCEALGIQEVVVVAEAGEPFRPSGRVTQNAFRWLDLSPRRDFASAAAALRGRGLRLLAAAVQGQPLSEVDFTAPTALVLGNESRGLPEPVVAACDETFSIPMYGLSQSLNVSVAAGIALHWAVETRRRVMGQSGDLERAERAELRRRFYLQAAGAKVPEELRRQIEALTGPGSDLEPTDR
jgi:tRNA (guanosine-2'-O-)-methyltransferase